MTENLKGLQLYQNLIQEIEQSGVSPVLALFILKTLTYEISDLTNNAAIQETQLLNNDNEIHEIQVNEVKEEVAGQE